MRALALSLLLCAACGGARTQPAVAVTIAAPPPPAATASPAPTSAAAAAAPSRTGRPTSIPGTSIRFEGGDGSSMPQAIVIRGAKGEGDGVAAEYKYLEMLYGSKGSGHNVRQQALLENGARSFDRLDVDLKDGRSIAVYFDITEYFGKF